MRALLSTIGSRGDVQPMVALASQLKSLGQEVLLCVPPDFQAWIEDLGMPVAPIGPELRSTAKASPATAAPSPDQARRMVEDSVAAQFEQLTSAARGCDVVVAATALQIAARSVAEKAGIPYVFAAYSPAVLPSLHHPPPVLGMMGEAQRPAPVDYPGLWARDAQRFDTVFGPALNARRAFLRLPPVDDVRSHIFGERPWLAADATLAPWPDPDDRGVFQTGAWLLEDARPLPAEVVAFLDAGEPPVYFGFGSMRAPQDLAQVFLQSARAVGRRAIVSRGWADLATGDEAEDCLLVDEINQQVLFRRSAAVVHHGGAGTTTAAARAGVPQVVVPQMYDQHYWAERILDLGLGAAHAPGTPTADSLIDALRRALQPDVADRARSVAADVSCHGAETAARRLIEISMGR